MEQADAVASPKLRVLYVAVAAILLALWGWSLVPAIQNWNNPNEDGFFLVPGFYATITLLLAFEIFRRLSNAMGS